MIAHVEVDIEVEDYVTDDGELDAASLAQAVEAALLRSGFPVAGLADVTEAT